MSWRGFIQVAVIAVGCGAALPARAQSSGAYLGYSVGKTGLHAAEFFQGVENARPRWIEAGWVTSRGFFVEARGTHIRESTRTWPQPLPSSDGATTIRMRATLVDGSVGYRPARMRFGPLQPVASVGITWARIIDSWESDTPEERLKNHLAGANLSAGLEAGIGPFALIARSTYRTLESGERLQPNISIDRLSWDAGARLRF